MAGKKHDTGKPRLDLVDGYFPRALEAVGDVCAFGASLHGEYTWDTIEDPDKRYNAAGRRHQLALNKGETNDKYSKLHHKAHKAWNALAELELELRKQTD